MICQEFTRETHLVFIEYVPEQISDNEYIKCWDIKEALERCKNAGKFAVFIKFNGDSYKINGKTIKSCFKTDKETGDPIIKCKKDWNERLATLKETISFWLDNKPTKEVTFANLFFDHN